MAVCIDCGREVSFFGRVGGRCEKCQSDHVLRSRLAQEYGQGHIDDLDRQRAEDKAVHLRNAQYEEQQIEQIVLTTEAAPNIEIIERIEIITAECAYGMHVFKDLFAGVRDIVGGRSKAVQENMRSARRTALMELKREAYAVGANAVVGVDLDYVELSSQGSMIMLVASGTAVKAKL